MLPPNGQSAPTYLTLPLRPTPPSSEPTHQRHRRWTCHAGAAAGAEERRETAWNMLWTNRPISRDNGDTRSSGLATPITAHEKALALQLWNPTHPVLYQILQGASRSRDSRERERESCRQVTISSFIHQASQPQLVRNQSVLRLSLGPPDSTPPRSDQGLRIR
jgi:hypothetical protein